MAGRPRKPTAHLEAVGAFKKNPDRKRDVEPQSTEPVSMPNPLSARGRRVWRFLVKTSAEGVLGSMDSAYLALCCEAVARCWYPEEGEKPATMADLQRAGNMLVRLGFTPTERSKIVVPKKQEKSVFDQFKRA